MVSGGARLYALFQDTGEINWTRKLVEGRIYASPCIAYGHFLEVEGLCFISDLTDSFSSSTYYRKVMFIYYQIVIT